MESNDIVARLRKEISKRDRPYPVELLPELREAADEIEDLRFQLEGTKGELENALSRERTLLKEQEDCRIGNDNLHAEIERLRADVMCLKHQNAEFVRNLTMAQDERNAAVAERDEARREVCNLIDAQSQLWCKDVAKHRGWDCFKEDSHGR